MSKDAVIEFKYRQGLEQLGDKLADRMNKVLI